MEFYGMQWESHRIQLNSIGIAWNSIEIHGIPKNSMGIYGIPLESHGI